MRSDIMQQAQAIRASIDRAAGYLTDRQAASAPLLYPSWAAGGTVAADARMYYAATGTKGRLYKAARGHTTQEGWEPDKTPALWTVIEVEHTGVQDDPIPAARGMEYVYGLYYLDGEDGKLYLCQRTGEVSGGTVVLQYLPHELMGHYFTEVT